MTRPNIEKLDCRACGGGKTAVPMLIMGTRQWRYKCDACGEKGPLMPTKEYAKQQWLIRMAMYQMQEEGGNDAA